MPENIPEHSECYNSGSVHQKEDETSHDHRHHLKRKRREKDRNQEGEAGKSGEQQSLVETGLQPGVEDVTQSAEPQRIASNGPAGHNQRRKKYKQTGLDASNKDTRSQTGNMNNKSQSGSPASTGHGNNGTAREKGQRFIVFIGNLPYSTTKESIASHFDKVHPSSVRLPTKKDDGKSKGFAFLEFEAYDRMKTCLNLYHHSLFDDGVSHPRKINVELTAGGGGAKSEERRTKLKYKNERLNQQRMRRRQAEMLGKKNQDSPVSLDGLTTDEPNHIHPSRRKIVSL
ncbi:MAG: hypothetical protein M1834_003447 [Cirrosporium novae-zelandiae]|nr:MAG: hypothetical protein M1834_003447 [Cirrosporium novae-zelandiae]